MRPKEEKNPQIEMFEKKLVSLVDKSHRLIKLSERIDWERFEEKFGLLYCADNGRPGLRTRLMVGLSYLKYLHNLSDQEVLTIWVENPYWQYFCGEEYFQHTAPCHHSNMSRWRNKIGEDGASELLEESLAVVKEAGLLKMSYLKELYVDTTVQEKNITYPTEGKLLHRAKCKLVSLCKGHGIVLRQNYNRVARMHLIMAHRYSAALQYNRARREVRKLRTIVGRVIRDISRKLSEAQKPYFEELLELSRQVLYMHEGGEKIYSLHEPATEAIAKGKIHKRFEYGVKVSVVATRKGGFVLGCKAIHGNPYDGHTLEEALNDVKERLGGILRCKVGVDLGYRGHGIKKGEQEDKSYISVLHPRLKNLSYPVRLFVRARSKIEAVISLLKRAYRLGRNYLSGVMGDQINALCSGAAYNLGIFLRSTA